jgi:hypothetical protein
MRNLQLEAELAAHSEHHAPPLTWWRSLPANVFISERAIAEAAVVSVVTASKLAPPDLIGDMLSAQAEEKIDVFNRLSVHFNCMDAMHMGILWEVAGTCSALAAADYDPVGLLRTLKALSEPYITARPEMRLSVAATWLGEMGGILNPKVMSRVDWDYALGGERSTDDDTSIWEGVE